MIFVIFFLDILVRGCYVIFVSGKLLGYVVREFKVRGVIYKIRDRIN